MYNKKPSETLQSYFDCLVHDVPFDYVEDTGNVRQNNVEQQEKLATNFVEKKSNKLRDEASSQNIPKREVLDTSAEASPYVESAKEFATEKRDEREYRDVEEEALEKSKRRQLQSMLDRQTLGVIKRDSKPLEEVKPPQINIETVDNDGQGGLAKKLVEKKNIDLSEGELKKNEPQEALAELSPTASTTGINSHYEWAENGRPVWAQEKFDALLFDVAGLTLAVPLMALGQILPMSDALTPIFGQAKWFMGLMPTPQGKLRTLNTALFVMPEKYDKSFLDTAGYIISIDGMAWGMAVNSVNQPVVLDPTDVKWRTNRSKRPWLAGTVKSAMCALLDIPQMANILSGSAEAKQL